MQRVAVSADKAPYVAALRAHAARLEKGRPAVGQLMQRLSELFEFGEPDKAEVYKRKANIIEKAPGSTTEQVFKEASASRSNLLSMAQMVREVGSLAGIAAGAAIMLNAGALFPELAAGAAFAVTPAVALGMGLAVKGGFSMTAGCIEDFSKVHTRRMEAVGMTSNDSATFYGEEAFIADTRVRLAEAG